MVAKSVGKPTFLVPFINILPVFNALAQSMRPFFSLFLIAHPKHMECVIAQLFNHLLVL